MANVIKLREKALRYARKIWADYLFVCFFLYLIFFSFVWFLNQIIKITHLTVKISRVNLSNRECLVKRGYTKVYDRPGFHGAYQSSYPSMSF